MKKIFLLTLTTLMLCGCQGKAVDTSDLKIICPTGAPAYAFYNHSQNKNFETNNTPSNIVAMMSSSSDKDIVVIDTVSGVKAIKNGAPFKLASNITFGNFFIAATGNDDDAKMNDGDVIVLFGEHQTPDLLFSYLYGTSFDTNKQFVTNVQDAAKVLITGKNFVTGDTADYVFIAQPVLYNALAKNPNASKYIDIQEEYSKKSGGKEMLQASVFIKDTVEQKVGKQFLEDLNNDIDNALKDPTVIVEALKNLSEEEVASIYGVDPTIVSNVIQDNNGLGLGYKKAVDNKQNIDSFLSLFDLGETSEEIYYK